MLRQDRARSCAPGPRHRSRLAQKCRPPAERATEKSIRNTSFRDSFALYLLHHFPNRFIDLPHVLNTGCCPRRERTELLKPGELFTDIFDQRLVAKLG